MNPLPLVVRAGRCWHSPRPLDLAVTLDRRPDMHRWAPPPGAADVRRAELARFYHKDPRDAARRVPSSALVISTDGTIRVSGDEPARCAAILDQLAAEGARQVGQLAIAWGQL